MTDTTLLNATPAQLVELALEVLRGRLQAALTEEGDRAAAQAAFRALAVAKAELTADPAIAARELAEIEALLGRDFAGDAVAARRALAAEIRARRVPADAAAAVRLRDHLVNAAAHRLRLSNPKYMTRRQRRAESSY
ncbi:MAG TPA: DUF6285 domain-containing protein [Alphaproteobacteria bacterium]|nr:DUF6285 domain-containing protein [Alphaproteobacteria bacterium]